MPSAEMVNDHPQFNSGSCNTPQTSSSANSKKSVQQRQSQVVSHNRSPSPLNTPIKKTRIAVTPKLLKVIEIDHSSYVLQKRLDQKVLECHLFQPLDNELNVSKRMVNMMHFFVLHPSLKMPDPAYIQTQVRHELSIMYSQLKVELYHVRSKIHLSIDYMQDEESKYSFLMIGAHFIDDKWKVQRLLLDMHPIINPSEIPSCIKSTITQCDIGKKIGCITKTENLTECLALSLSEWFANKHSTGIGWIQCSLEFLKKLVNAAVDGFDLFDRLLFILEFIESHQSHINTFVKLKGTPFEPIGHLGFLPKTFKAMYEFAMNINHLKAFALAFKLEWFNQQEIDKMIAFHQMILHFEELYRVLDTNNITISLASIFVPRFLERISVFGSGKIADRAAPVLKLLNEYSMMDFPQLQLATLLDARIKDTIWYGCNWSVEDIARAKLFLMAVCSFYASEAAGASGQAQENQPMFSSADVYLQLPVIPVDFNPLKLNDTEHKLLEYWRAYQEFTPSELNRLAQDYLSIPSTAEFERTFSVSRDILKYASNHEIATYACMKTMLRSWKIRRGLVNPLDSQMVYSDVGPYDLSAQEDESNGSDDIIEDCDDKVYYVEEESEYSDCSTDSD